LGNWSELLVRTAGTNLGQSIPVAGRALRFEHSHVFKTVRKDVIESFVIVLKKMPVSPN
jgi:hypothetical protein